MLNSILRRGAAGVLLAVITLGIYQSQQLSSAGVEVKQSVPTGAVGVLPDLRIGRGLRSLWESLVTLVGLVGALLVGLVHGAQWVWSLITPARVLVTVLLLAMFIGQYQYRHRLRSSVSAQGGVTMGRDAAAVEGVSAGREAAVVADVPPGEEWGKVEKALQDPRWDFRTVNGIAKETHLSPRLVKRLLRTNESQLRRRILRRGQGEFIYTLKARPKKLREILFELQAFAGR